MKEQYDQAKTQWAKMMEENPAKELTEDEIAERVKSSIKYKMQASSVSATDDEVFLATHATAGYGFDVWRMDPQFESGERIITGLSGCCGQMDLQGKCRRPVRGGEFPAPRLPLRPQRQTDRHVWFCCCAPESRASAAAVIR